MKTWKIAIVAATACALGTGGTLLLRNRCAPLDESARAKLINFVRKRYGVPAETALQVSVTSLAGSACYRKLEFRSEGAARPFRVSLFATPDLRYLAPQLLDSAGDSSGAPAGGRRDLPKVADGDHPSAGPADARVTITVFSDFECPYCARFASMMRKEVLPEAGGHARLVFRQFPLPMHPWARAAAEASLCAYRQKNDYFWSFHDFFFDHQGELTPGVLKSRIEDHARTLPGLDRGKFDACLSAPETKAAIEQEIAYGNQNGIHATPTAFVNGTEAHVRDAPQMLALVREIDKNPAALVPLAPARARNRRPPVHEVAGVAKGDLPSFGPPHAQVTITVFSDFECPYCAKFADTMRTVVLPGAGENARVVFRYFPLSIHPWAREAAEIAACAYMQKADYFRDFHDFFFSHQKDLTAANLRQQVVGHARGIDGLDRSKFQACLDNHSATAIVDRDVAFGNSNGIQATPTVFLNGRETEIVAPEQLLTLVRELSVGDVAATRLRPSAPGTGR